MIKMRDPSREIRTAALLLFGPEIKQLEEDGYLVIYRNIFIETGMYFLDIDIIKNGWLL